jgi:hypothetical protein
VGRSVADVFAGFIAQGYDIRPTIAVTKAHIHLPEVRQAIAFQRLPPTAACCSTTARPWSPRSRSSRCGGCPASPGASASRGDLRRALFEETGGMYPELVTRSDLEVFLPPIGGQTLYIFGNPRDLADPASR